MEQHRRPSLEGRPSARRATAADNDAPAEPTRVIELHQLAVIRPSQTWAADPDLAARRQRECSLDRGQHNGAGRSRVDGLRPVLGEHDDDITLPRLGGGQVAEGQDAWPDSALPPGGLPLSRVELENVVVERKHLADRGQARPARAASEA